MPTIAQPRALPRSSKPSKRRGLPPVRVGGNISRVNLPDLLSRARAHDREALEALCERFYPSVRDMVHRELALDLRRGRPWLTALFSTGDVVHDVFLGVLRDLPQFQGEDERTFEGFLASAVTHRLIYMIRHHQAGCRDGRRRAPDAAAETLPRADDATSPTQAASRNEATAAVRSELVRLASRDRVLLEMRFRQEASYQAIAETFDLPSAEAARKAVRTARARLLVRLRERGVAEA